MSEQREFVLGPTALEFLKSSRRAFGHTLSQYLLDALDLHPGTITTDLPDDVSPERLYDRVRREEDPVDPHSQR